MVFIREDRLFPVERVKVRNLGGVLGIEFSNELLRRPNQVIKRFLDIILGMRAGDCGAYSCALRIADKAGEPRASLLSTTARGIGWTKVQGLETAYDACRRRGSVGRAS